MDAEDTESISEVAWICRHIHTQEQYMLSEGRTGVSIFERILCMASSHVTCPAYEIAGGRTNHPLAQAVLDGLMGQVSLTPFVDGDYPHSGFVVPKKCGVWPRCLGLDLRKGCQAQRATLSCRTDPMCELL
jgi:hypothetical protein